MMFEDFSSSIFLGLGILVTGALLLVGEMIEQSTNNPLSYNVDTAIVMLIVGIFLLSYGLSKKRGKMNE